VKGILDQRPEGNERVKHADIQVVKHYREKTCLRPMLRSILYLQGIAR
jgi:hypothetical protein